MNGPKIPSSLKWFLNRRARIASEISKAQDAENDRLQAVQAKLAQVDAQRAKLVRASDRMALAHKSLCDALSRDLTAIDQVLQLHEVSIDRSLLPPVRGHNRIAATDHGQMTRLIFACLQSRNGKACTTTQVALYVASKLGSTGRTENFDDLCYRVRYRLKELVSKQPLAECTRPGASLTMLGASSARCRIRRSQGPRLEVVQVERVAVHDSEVAAEQ